jgi:gluconate 5-dehydrogenase
MGLAERARGLPQTFDLSGRVAFVVGAAHGGLGFHIARALAEAGADVAVGDVGARADDLDATAEHLLAIGRRAISVEVDVSSESQIGQAVDAVADAFGTIDILVCNAGISIRVPALKMLLEDWQRILDVNLTGAWLLARRVAPLMLSSSTGGSIINIASQYSNIVGSVPQAPYYASKSAITNLSRALAMEWGREGIRVNSIAPGFFYPTHLTSYIGDDERRLDSLANRTLLGRIGNPAEDLDGPIVFLASDASKYVTGQVLFVDGGWTSW